ncbi:RNA ligase [Natrinema thermotolerans]|uniref:RNA ligase n=1 Tax=Natrinema thermotolerans TaxID=121872 RepID=A0AAF0P9Q7_9EURY|nr:RNA ligase [Natrinema thermotolerans]QCC60433.1 RNA ligase [Natrinema thermotolerans]QCC61338.1 RNA ligase [Natrinema thermotolerans]WMT07461.1 RNA ligase [Natrinema thermotolerans]WMT08093.1 RNA ligase [Natrinema thermotolerans]
MDRDAYRERLAATTDDPADLFEHFEERSVAGRTHHVLTAARHGVERGTVVVEDADVVVRGYPSIPRILVLEPGIESFFAGTETVVVEEKLDGFNVRIAAVGGEPLAFTRSGYVCPYTTARARALLDLESFFDAHPDRVLCAELIGPETPYTTTDYEGIDSHDIRVFDVRDGESGEPMSVADRRALCRAFDFGQPRCFGRAAPSDAVEIAAAAIADLDAAGREGVVLKSADGESMVKYTTASQHREELAYAFSLPFECGRDFVFSRIVREAFRAAEFAENDDRLRERAHDLGEAILLPMVATIRSVAVGKPIGQRHTVRGDPDALEALFDHLREQSLTIEIEADRREDGDRVVAFRKVADSSRDRIRHYLDGGTRDE